MGALFGLVAVLVLAALVWWRIREARRATARAPAAPPDIRLTVRRLMEGNGKGPHPADAVDDARLAAAGVVVAVATMDGPISLAEIARLKRAAQEIFEMSEREALDVVSYGRWIAAECGGNDEAVGRLSEVVLRQAGPAAGPDLVRMAEEVAGAGGTSLGPEQREALAGLRRSFGMETAPRGR